jgi:hypothetical protein
MMQEFPEIKRKKEKKKELPKGRRRCSRCKLKSMAARKQNTADAKR